ncbi:MucR family transcriptional regulator [Phyllobacterium phragmitis]|uniref:MucR family transcriptional regulator n=1 Tax=Phyllobacterium phragmitis TaxID=2670329 RepID=UPI003CC923C0
MQNAQAASVDARTDTGRISTADDYPLVAPSYSEQRRKVARELGLGRKGVRRLAPRPMQRRQRAWHQSPWRRTEPRAR